MDIAVGAPGAATPNPLKPGKLLKKAGAVYSIDFASQKIVGQINGTAANAEFGTQLQVLQDIDGDGFSDWLFATPKQLNPLAANNKKAPNAGLMQVISGKYSLK